MLVIGYLYQRWLVFLFYRPPMKLQEGNVLSCLSVCMFTRGAVFKWMSLNRSYHMGTPTLRLRWKGLLVSSISRMQSSRMRTICCSGRLSRPAHPPATHAPDHATPYHACPPATHTPCQICPLPCTTPPCHAPCHAQPPPPVDRMTDACENITFPQLLLRTVISVSLKFPFMK